MRARTRALVAVSSALAAVGLLAACSAVLGVQSDRYVVAVDADDGAVSADWSCLGVPPTPMATGMVELKMLLNDVSASQTSGNFAGNLKNLVARRVTARRIPKH